LRKDWTGTLQGRNVSTVMLVKDVVRMRIVWLAQKECSQMYYKANKGRIKEYYKEYGKVYRKTNAEAIIAAKDNLSKNNSFTPYTEVYDSLGDVILQTSLKLAA